MRTQHFSFFLFVFKCYRTGVREVGWKVVGREHAGVETTALGGGKFPRTSPGPFVVVLLPLDFVYLFE